MQKDRCLKTGGGGRGSQENLCKMFSARAAVARAASGRLDHGRRYLNRKLRAAGEALRFPLVNAMRHEQSRLYFQRLRDGAGSMGVKSSRMALRLLRATAAPASTTSLPNIFLGRSWRLGPRQNLGQKTKMLLRGPGGPARAEIRPRRPSDCDKKAARREACARSATAGISLD